MACRYDRKSWFFVVTAYYTVVLGAGLRIVRMKKGRT